jgi:TonB family protein
MSTASFAIDQNLLRREDDRRLWVAVAISLVAHSLTIAALRSLTPAVHAYSASGVGAVAALQAVLAGPAIKLPDEPLKLIEPMLETPLLAPAKLKPVETKFGRSQVQTAPVPGGGPSAEGPITPYVSVAVGTIGDAAMLGSRYASDLAQKYPTRPSKEAMMLGSLGVAYPYEAQRAGIEGRFAVVVNLDARGRVTSKEMVIDDPIFGPVMLDALNSASFSPAEVDAKPIPYWIIVEFIFSIGRPTPPAAVAAGPNRGRGALPRQPIVGR